MKCPVDDRLDASVPSGQVLARAALSELGGAGLVARELEASLLRSVGVCVLVVGNASMIDLLLYGISVGKIIVSLREAANPWMAWICGCPKQLRL